MKLCLLLAPLLFAGCLETTSPLDAGFRVVGIETKGKPVTLQLLAGGGLSAGLYRYVDKETGVVLYVVEQFQNIALTAVRVK